MAMRIPSGVLSRVCNGFKEKKRGSHRQCTHFKIFQLSEQNENLRLFVTRHSNQVKDSMGQ
jgi:hypothetical protein